MYTTTSFRELLLEQLRDPEFASAYLRDALASRDPIEIADTLRDIAKAQGVPLPLTDAA
jgi:DNA-binding phage protein